MSWRGKITRWDVSRGRIAEVIEFDRPVRLLKALDDRLILEDLDRETMFSAVDRNGQMLVRFGKPLVLAKNPNNNAANSFFAFFQDGLIRVLFKYYPIYRVYDVDGWLVEEGRYETPDGDRFQNLNPPLEEVADSAETIESWFPEIMLAKAGSDGLHIYFAGFTYGLLDRSFRLVVRWFLPNDPVFAASPKVFDIDTGSRRLLLSSDDQDGQPRFSFVYFDPSTAGPRQRLAVDVFLTGH